MQKQLLLPVSLCMSFFHMPQSDLGNSWEVPSTTVLVVSPFDYDSTGSWEIDLQEAVITKQLFLE